MFAMWPVSRCYPGCFSFRFVTLCLPLGVDPGSRVLSADWLQKALCIFFALCPCCGAACYVFQPRLFQHSTLFFHSCPLRPTRLNANKHPHTRSIFELICSKSIEICFFVCASSDADAFHPKRLFGVWCHFHSWNL